MSNKYPSDLDGIDGLCATKDRRQRNPDEFCQSVPIQARFKLIFLQPFQKASAFSDPSTVFWPPNSHRHKHCWRLDRGRFARGADGCCGPRRGRFFRCHDDSRRQDNDKKTGQRGGGGKETVHFHSGLCGLVGIGGQISGLTGGRLGDATLPCAFRPIAGHRTENRRAPHQNRQIVIHPGKTPTPRFLPI
jgi:hypothetical protein